MIQFTDSITSKLYEPLTDVDQWLQIPPDAKGECKCKEYAGWLSNIDEHAAERYIKFGGNLIRAKAEDEIVIKTDFDALLRNKRESLNIPE